jgi:hypothetical protein
MKVSMNARPGDVPGPLPPASRISLFWGVWFNCFGLVVWGVRVFFCFCGGVVGVLGLFGWLLVGWVVEHR